MEWISVKERLPEDGAKVKYRIRKNICGFYTKVEFYTGDHKAILPISHLPQNNNQP
jgi:hypothetical protein